ncbi:hypothetical protein ACN47E_005350 [Coniothyrium glycines]
MLNCRACLWRCIDALDVPAIQAGRIHRSLNRNIQSRQQRDYRTHNDPTVNENTEHSAPSSWKNSEVAANRRKREKEAVWQKPIRPSGDQTPSLAKLGSRDASVSGYDWNRRKKELRYIQDPLELARFVKQELKKDKVSEMVQLVNMASHSMECIVSYNHIIDHLLATRKVKEALKLYNDMKKRGQFPDSYTYTILLRGLSANATSPSMAPSVLIKALSIYHSLSAPNSRVEPNIIHTNVALQVCARALDMDALWSIAGKIPDKGPGRANAVTYVTILNAIRQNLIVNPPRDETEEEAAARKERGMVEGRRMWGDIVTRWRNADLAIDEELVCAMGRLLLVGARPRDWDDVLSLVEQTMDIPRLVPRLGTVERQKMGVPKLRAPPGVSEQYRFDDDHLAPDQPPMRGSEFLAVIPQGPGGFVSSPSKYVRPGNNTLSLIQEACQKVVAQKAAQEYWYLLTDPATYNIKPDFNNLTMRLRVLRQSRASAAVVKFLQENMIEAGIMPQRGTFRIAMSTCVRDKNNHRSLMHGGQILSMMMKTLEDADPKAVAMYAELAISFPLATGQDLVDVLTVLYPIVRNLRLQLGIGGQRRGANGVGATYLKREERTDAIIALRKVYGLYDRLVFSNLIEEGQKAPFKAERARLQAFLSRVQVKSEHDKSASWPVRFRPTTESEEATEHGYLESEGAVEGDTETETVGRTSEEQATTVSRHVERRAPRGEGQSRL